MPPLRPDAPGAVPRSRARLALRKAAARLARLGTGRRRAPDIDHWALIVAVQEADHALGRLRRGQPLGIPAHVTVSYPFRPHGGVTPEVQEELRALFGAFAGFSARFSRIERFPGVLYLAPEPVDRFVELTEAVVARWPESPPYEGAYTTIVPHLTVSEGPEPRRLAARVQRRLPIDAAVHEVVLMRPDRRGRWSLVCSFPLGAT